MNNSRNVSHSDEICKNNHIVMWGPTGAGKDWLLRSFAKELEYYNATDLDFHYELEDNFPGQDITTPKVAIPPSPILTDVKKDLSYVFRRVARKMDIRSRISQQQHEIIIHNDAGANLTGCLEPPDSFESTHTALIHTRNMLLVLGIPGDEMAAPSSIETNTFVDTVEDYSSSDVSKERAWSRSTYKRFVELLFNNLSKGPRRNLAVCMTKCDQLGLKGSPLEMLEIRHGSAMRELLELNSQKHNIEIFLTSAAGYLMQDGKLIPNFQNSKILDEIHWHPINTASPFFWIFEKIERERLQKGSIFSRRENLGDCIGYDWQRGF